MILLQSKICSGGTEWNRKRNKQAVNRVSSGSTSVVLVVVVVVVLVVVVPVVVVVVVLEVVL